MLSSGTELNERYTLRQILDGAGAFSVTYLGHDAEEDQEVVVTEYFPRHLAERAADGRAVQPTGDEQAFQQGLKYFHKEAKVLREIDHTNLAREIEAFDAHGTAYRVSAHRAGASLATALKKNDGSISERAALTVMKPVLSALHAVHRKGLLHGGLSPEAIYLTKSRKVLLRGFRSAQLQLARKTGALEKVVVPGISPAEQYTADGRQGPWTDVYAAAATLYRVVTGQALPEAREPLAEDTVAECLDCAEGLSDGVRRVLERALAPRPRGRLQSAQAFQELVEHPSKLIDEEPKEQNALEEDADAQEADAQEADAQEVAGSQQPEVWGPASIAAAAAEAAKKDKEKARERRKEEAAAAAANEAREARSAAPGRAGGGEHGGLPVSNRLAMGGGAILLIVLLVGAGLLFGVLGGGESNAEGSTGARYETLLAEGDSLYEQADYRAAAARYEKAKEVHPEDDPQSGRVNERLLMIDRLQDAVGNETYRRAMSRGDSLMARAQQTGSASGSGALNAQARMLYEQANQAYFAALNSRRGDSLALARTRAVSSALEADNANAAANEETSLAEERQRLFERYRDQGDAALDSSDYETARRKFREALDYQPDSEYVADKLEEISSLMGEAQRQEQHERYQRRADSLFAAGQLSEARREYQLVLDVKPDDSTAARRVSTIDQRLAQRQKNQQQYQYHRGRGDLLFDDGELEQAVQSYNEALKYRPEDEYVKGRLAEAQQKIDEAEKVAQEEAKDKARRTENGVYKFPDEEPKIVGGLSALYDQISYPSSAQRQGVEGRVYLKVTVSADGTAQKIEKLRGIGYGADEEAMRVVRNAAFEPATVEGQPVPAFKTLMVQFRLDEQD